MSETHRPTMGNLFSGSGTWELAAKMVGIDVLFEAEIEPFPLAVEAKRFPEALQLGDVSKINGADIPPVDILTNSSPCQDLSVANSKNRTGLEGERSGLFSEAIRITKEMREREKADGRTGKSIRPRFWGWENVPGAFNSGGKGSKGADFKAVLESIAEIIEEKRVDIPIPNGGGGTTQDWSILKTDRSHGESLMHSTNYRKDGDGYFLSQILQDIVPSKYFLSVKASLGILRRSLQRGKTLPEVLETALVRQAELSWAEYEELKKEWASAA